MVIFLLSLCLWDIFMRIAYLFGYQASQRTIHALMWLMIQQLRIAGARVRLIPKRCEIPHTRPLILVSNHQSMFDIPFAFWYFRQFNVKFVAKRELAYNAPTVSFHLRNGHHALIDRKDREQASRAIAEMGQKAEKARYAALIYPEGSRSKDGNLREFKLRGLAVMLENMPSALVVPLCIDGSWQLAPRGFSCIPWGVRCSMEVLEPIEPTGLTPEEVLALCETRIREKLGQTK